MCICDSAIFLDRFMLFVQIIMWYFISTNLTLFVTFIHIKQQELSIPYSWAYLWIKLRRRVFDCWTLHIFCHFIMMLIFYKWGSCFMSIIYSIRVVLCHVVMLLWTGLYTSDTVLKSFSNNWWREIRVKCGMWNGVSFRTGWNELTVFINLVIILFLLFNLFKKHSPHHLIHHHW